MENYGKGNITVMEFLDVYIAEKDQFKQKISFANMVSCADLIWISYRRIHGITLN